MLYVVSNVVRGGAGLLNDHDLVTNDKDITISLQCFGERLRKQVRS